MSDGKDNIKDWLLVFSETEEVSISPRAAFVPRDLHWFFLSMT